MQRCNKWKYKDNVDIEYRKETEDDTNHRKYIIHVNIKYTKSKRLCGSMNMSTIDSKKYMRNNENLMHVNHLCLELEAWGKWMNEKCLLIRSEFMGSCNL